MAHLLIFGRGSDRLAQLRLMCTINRQCPKTIQQQSAIFHKKIKYATHLSKFEVRQVDSKKIHTVRKPYLLSYYQNYSCMYKKN